ncbi:MAG: alpha/beta hydrolase, partial [Alphaproteobacteria bacterium]
AQITYDLNFDGAPILYSWPSRGSTFAYVRDEAVVRLSGRHLVRFLDDVVARSGARHINLIAHSMGNRAMIDALELIAVRRLAKGRTGPLFEQAIFAAPDEDAALFAEMLSVVRPIARRVTLYGSENDVALSASRALHGDYNRAGQGGDALLVADGVDSIDMSELGSDILGHSYFAASASALTDMSWLFWQDAPPDRRCGMDGKSRADGRFWLFDPLRCNGPVLLSALTMLRAGGAATLARLERLLANAKDGGRTAEAAEWDAIRQAAIAVMGAR